MNPTTLAFLVGVLLGAPAGLILAALFAASARADAEQAAYTRGLAKGRALKRANVAHDIIANDTASAFPREPAA